jgi:hypothetical protein
VELYLPTELGNFGSLRLLKWMSGFAKAVLPNRLGVVRKEMGVNEISGGKYKTPTDSSRVHIH